MLGWPADRAFVEIVAALTRLCLGRRHRLSFAREQRMSTIWPFGVDGGPITSRLSKGLFNHSLPAGHIMFPGRRRLQL